MRRRWLALAGAVPLLVLVGLLVWQQRTLGTAAVLFAGTEEDADCAILLSDGACAVIDAGEEQDGPHIVELLEAQGVDRIDCLLLTHPDKDHVGGAALLLDRFPVGRLVTPAYDREDKRRYWDLLAQAEALGIPVEQPQQAAGLSCGDWDLQLLPPREAHYKKSNNYSLAISARHGEVTVFLAGDAENKRIGELLDLPLPREVDLYKVAHHGRDSQKGPALIRKLSPVIAVVPAREPEPETRQALEAAGAVIYSTVGQDLCFHSDGHRLTLQQP